MKPKSKKKIVGDTAGHFDSNNSEQEKKWNEHKMVNRMNNISERETLCAD